MKAIKVIIILLLVLSIILIFSINSQDNPSVFSTHMQKENGIVTNIWLYETSRLDKIRQNSIKYLFVDIGGTNQDGTISTPKEEIISFLDFLEDYESKNDYKFIILPYSEINTDIFDIKSQGFIENFINSYLELSELGFDGILVDIEPVKLGQREYFLDFLRQLKLQMPKNSIISVYTGNIAQSHVDWEWSPDFYLSVASLVNFLSTPAYDTSIQDKKEYDSYIYNQLNKISELKLNSRVLLAIPTHKPYPETIQNSLEVFNKFIRENPDKPFKGHVIFAEWTMDEEEWTAYEDLNSP